MWFSAMLNVAVSVGQEPSSLWRTVVVFEAPDGWDAGSQKALALGRQKEGTYENADGQTVTHRLVAVETLDMLGETLADGREVYFERREAPATPPTSVPPEELAPGQSGV